MLGVADCVGYRVWFVVPQRTEWQRIGNQIKAAFIFARAGLRKRALAASLFLWRLQPGKHVVDLRYISLQSRIPGSGILYCGLESV
jgi:hypothetical protein